MNRLNDAMFSYIISKDFNGSGDNEDLDNFIDALRTVSYSTILNSYDDIKDRFKDTGLPGIIYNTVIDRAVDDNDLFNFNITGYTDILHAWGVNPSVSIHIEDIEMVPSLDYISRDIVIQRGDLLEETVGQNIREALLMGSTESIKVNMDSKSIIFCSIKTIFNTIPLGICRDPVKTRDATIFVTFESSGLVMDVFGMLDIIRSYRKIQSESDTVNEDF